MFSELFAPVSIGVRTIAKTVRILERNQMGLSISDVLRMFLVCFASEKKFPFDYEVPNAVTLAAIEEAESGKLKSYDSVDDFFKKMKL